MKNNDTAIAIGLLLLRVAIGGLMMVHGWQKLSGFSDMADTFPDPIGLGSTLSLMLTIGAEFGCSMLLMVGLLTRLAVIPLAFTMMVALFIVHGDDSWEDKELAAVYLSVYLSLFFSGAGSLSLDHAIFRAKPVADSNA